MNDDNAAREARGGKEGGVKVHDGPLRGDGSSWRDWYALRGAKHGRRLTAREWRALRRWFQRAFDRELREFRRASRQ